MYLFLEETSQNADYVKRQVDRMLADMRSKSAPFQPRCEIIVGKSGDRQRSVLEPVIAATTQVTMAVNAQPFRGGQESVGRRTGPR